MGKRRKRRKQAEASAPEVTAEAAPQEPPAETPEPPEEDAKAEERRRARIVRIGVLGFAAALAVAVVLTVARSGGLQLGSIEGSGSGSEGSGRARISNPAGPSLPSDPSAVRLTGVVVDGAGVAVVAAEVSAEPEKGVIDAALTGGASGSASGSGSGSGSGAPPIAVAQPTGADGRFAIEGLRPGRFRLRVTGPGLLASEVRYVPVPSDEARIVVARQVSIEGTVVDGGAPAVGVHVGLRGEAIGGTIETSSDGKGAFRFGELPEGRYQVFAWKEARAAHAVRVNRLGAGPFDPVQLGLEAASIVVGKVIDRDDSSGLAAAVELRPVGEDQAPRYARSADDGTFRIEGVPLGRWVGEAYAPGYTSPGSVELDAGHGVPELALARGAAIEGRVLDAAGNPIAGATVRAKGSGGATLEHSPQIEHDKLRRFSGRLATPIRGAAGGLASDPQLLPRGELGVLVGPIPPLPPPGALAIRPSTLDPDDPASSRSLAAEPAPLPEKADRAAIWTTGTDGRYRITGLPASTKIAVLAVAPGLAEGRSKPLSLALGQLATGIDVTLTAGTMLYGRVTDQHRAPIAGAQVTATPEPGAPIEAFTDDDGMYRLGPVSGTVALAASAYGHGEAHRKLEVAPERSAIAGERREDLTLAIADALIAGTLDDAAGAPVAAATLEVIGGAGDGRHAIVASDGTFALEGLPAGGLRVRITHPDYPPLELDAVAGPPTAPRVRWRMPLGGAVEGALLDGPSGSPLPGVPLSGDGPGSATADASTDADGRWRLGPLVPGKWKIEVALPGYRPFVRELDVPVARAPGEVTVRDIRIDLARGALVGGTVRDGRGLRVSGARVVAQVAGAAGPPCEGVTDQSGEFRLRDCPTGEVVVTASRGDQRGGERATLRPGDEVLTLSLEIK